MARVPPTGDATGGQAGDRKGAGGGQHEAIPSNVHGSLYVQQSDMDAEGEEGGVCSQRDVEQPTGASSGVLSGSLRRSRHV